jgi:pyruvate kinase
MQAPMPQHTRQVLATAGEFALKRGIAKRGDKIIVISGRPLGEPGRTNTLVVHTIENKS